MKTWAKVVLGAGVGAAIGCVAAFFGKHYEDGEEIYAAFEEAETDESEVEDEE